MIRININRNINLVDPMIRRMMISLIITNISYILKGDRNYDGCLKPSLGEYRASILW
jgi:hypothetical protein